jgi:hypothetical protein
MSSPEPIVPVQVCVCRDATGAIVAQASAIPASADPSDIEAATRLADWRMRLELRRRRRK